MNTILDKAVVEYNNKTEFGQDDKLILILRTIIILSQTFYNIEHPNGRKILQDDIKIHPIWKIFNIWKDIIDYHVNDTETSQNNTTSSKDKEKIKKDNITSALISFKMNMEFFGVPVSIITELMKSNCVLYGLNEQYLFF
jgi:transglutaminase/protease-like cytokinesis protein 3